MYFTAIAWTTPTFLMVGYVLLIPMGIIVESYMLDIQFKPMFYVGTAIVLFGFGLFTYGTSIETNTEKNIEVDNGDEVSTSKEECQV